MTLRTPLINCNSTTKSCPIFINNPSAFPSSSFLSSPLIPSDADVEEDLAMGPLESWRLAKDTYGDAVKEDVETGVEGKIDLRTKDEDEDEERDWRR